MNFFTIKEATENYSNSCVAKSQQPLYKLLPLSFLAGAIIALGAVAASSASVSIPYPSVARLVSSLLFPFGLGIIITMGLELFTGNCLMIIGVLDRKIPLRKLIYNWFIVYFGNFAGALAVSATYVFTGKLKANGMMDSAVATGIAKCSISFGSGVLLGIFCNFLVCLGVMMAITSKSTGGRILGAFIPVCIFVVCGFEHSIANMYYIPTAIFSQGLAATEALTWSGFIFSNLIPVTIGNIIGGLALGVTMWGVHLYKR